jgi:hypothetical protein
MHETSEVDQKAAIRTIIERIPGTQFFRWIGERGRREREEEKYIAEVLWAGQPRRLTFTQEDRRQRNAAGLYFVNYIIALFSA